MNRHYEPKHVALRNWGYVQAASAHWVGLELRPSIDQPKP